MKKAVSLVLGIALLASLAIACSGSAPTSTPTPTLAPPSRPAPTPTYTLGPTSTIDRQPRTPSERKAYVTPSDPVVQQKVTEILESWWRPGYSDFQALRQWTSSHIAYAYDQQAHGVSDYWQLPNETLALGTGDCEDFAILLCSMLRAWELSSDHVYVVLGRSEDLSHGHAYLIESYTTGEYRLFEPQHGVWLPFVYGEMLDQWNEVVFFNDQRYMTTWPDYECARYYLTGYPLMYTGRVHLKGYLTAGQNVSGVVAEVPPGDTSVWRDWGIEIKNPAGEIVISRDGHADEFAFSFKASQTGYYWIDLWNAGYEKIVELQIEPSGWEFIGGEHGSREAR